MGLGRVSSDKQTDEKSQSLHNITFQIIIQPQRKECPRNMANDGFNLV